jgi:PAS domain S-box-containing protein
MPEAPKGEGSAAAPAPTAERRVFPRAMPVSEDIIVPQEIQLLNQVVQQVRKERAFFHAVLQQMPAGVVIGTAPEGRLIMGNERVEQILGKPFQACQNFEEYSQWKGFHPDGRPYETDEWPMTRAIKFGESVAGEEIKFQRDNGSWCHVSCNSAPVRDEQGHIIAGVVSLYEITPRRHSKRHLPTGAKNPGDKP